MGKHTPGPWEIVDGHYPSMKEVKGPSFEVPIVMAATDLSFDDYLRRSADACLIAAAPDLLEACEAAEWNSLDLPEFVRIKIRAAIAKAKGEQS